VSSMSENVLYASLDRIVAQKLEVDKLLIIAQEKLAKLYSDQSIEDAGLIKAESLARDAVRIAHEVEQSLLSAERDVASLRILEIKNADPQTKESVKFRAHLTEAQIKVKNALAAAQLAALSAFKAQNNLAIAIVATTVLKDSVVDLPQAHIF